MSSMAIMGNCLKSILFFILCLKTCTSSIVSVSEDGGYHIVVAINPNVGVIPRNPTEYFLNMKNKFQIFSEQLATTTKGTFYVKEIDLIVPWSWAAEIPSGIPIPIIYASTQTFETADIRLSENFQTAYVENPNPCGFTGQYIELPLSFFDNEENNDYGPTWKALINQWARYRWGVWEEHGDPTNPEFPYFYKKPNGTNWLVSGCSDEPIVGNITNWLGEKCDIYGEEMPPSDCRLRPDNSKTTANSSLMHFHFLESVHEFCDDETHDPESPNRQNKYCGHHSIWEVIKGSLDYKQVTKRIDFVPEVNFNLAFITKRPLLYILIDEGRTNVPDYVIEQVYGNLTKLFDQYVEPQTVATIGTFPARPGSNQIVNERVHWKIIRDYRDDLIQGLQASLAERNSSRPPIRNFGEAILHAIRDINERRPTAGGILLVIKTGAGENTFNQITPESEIIAALDENQRIIIYGVEMPNSPSKPFDNNLKRIVEKTGGNHAIISKSYHIARDLIPMLDNINHFLNQPIIVVKNPDDNYGLSLYRQVILYKGFVDPSNTLSFPVFTDGFSSIQFYFTLTENINVNQIQLKSSEYSENIVMSSSNDWLEDKDYRRRNLYSFKTSEFTQPNATWTFQYNCNSADNLSCRGFFLVYGLIPKSYSNDIDVTVSTSAGNRMVDMSLYSNPSFIAAPFSIFAKVTSNRKPIRNLNIEATIQLIDGSFSSWKVKLLDSSSSNADIAENDGIYSGVFIPEIDGYYKIYVTVQTQDSLPEDEQEQRISLSKLLPINQINFGCLEFENDCKSIQLTKPFRRVVDLQNPVGFINTASYMKGTPYRITDLEVIANSNFFITFQFTTPRLIGMEGGATQFNFYLSPRPRTLIGTGLGNREIMLHIGDEPGKKFSVRIPALEEVTAYYCVEAINGELRSGSSNIFGVKTLLVGSNETSNDSTLTIEPSNSASSQVIPNSLNFATFLIPQMIICAWFI